MAKLRANWFIRCRDALTSMLDETVFLRSNGQEATRLHHFIHFWIMVGTSFARNRGPLRATALAYTTMLALVPILAVGLGVSTWMLKGQGGEAAIKEFVAEIVDEVAPQLGLMPRDGSLGTPVLSSGDIRNLPDFVAQLRNPTNRVSAYLWNQIPESQQQRVEAGVRAAGSGDEQKLQEAKENLVLELNAINASGPIYDEARFQDISLSTNVLAMTKEDLDGEKLMMLNRMLLEEVYPDDLAKSAGADARLMVKDRIQMFIANVHSGTLGLTGTIGLIFIAVGLLSNIESTFNDIWGVKLGRPWHYRVIQYWGVLTLGPMLIIFAMGLSIGGQVEKTQELIRNTLPVVGDLVVFVMVTLAPFLISLSLFSLLYMLIPNTRVDWRAAVVGGLVASLLWHLNNSLNVLFTSKVVSASKIYGPLSALPVFLIGLYFSWLILLFGAQVAYTFQFRRAYLQERQTETINQRGREFVALRMAACVGEQFQQGKPAPTAAEISDQLGVPVRLIHQVGDALLAAGLFTRVASEQMAYLPGRPLENISVHDVLLAMRAGQGEDLTTLEDPARSLVRSEYERIEDAERQVACHVSLSDVVNRLARPLEILPPEAGHSDPASTPAVPSREPQTSVTDHEPGLVTLHEEETIPSSPEAYVVHPPSHETASEDSSKRKQSESEPSQPASSVGDESFPL